MESGGSVSRPEMVSEDLLSGIGAGSNAVDLLDAHLDEVLCRSGLHPGVGDGDGLLVVGTDLKAQTRAVLLTEAAYVIAWFLAYGPLPALATASNLLGFLRLVARAWGILSLYKAQAADPTR